MKRKKKYISNFLYKINLINVLTFKEIKVKYKSSFLGYLWSVLHPLSLAIVFYFAFQIILKIPIENFTLFLITGLFPWQWFANSVASSAVSLIGNASLIKKINFPRYFIPLSNVLNDAFHYIVSLPIIFVFVLYYEIPLTLNWLYGIPLVVISQFIITYGFSLLVSSANLFFRDLERFVQIGLNILFYLTPIIYETKLIPEEYRGYLLLNPMYSIIENWHLIFMKGYLDFELYLISLGWGIAIFLLGFYVFQRLSWKFAEVL
ncbi:MAG: ABC transporter permease [Spirochaetia bacterium]|nr:ABC transporter permease [Spirochaetota bacterium]MDW8113197.1 ABC transporter permease [Spirochaetia bacterium]